MAQRAQREEHASLDPEREERMAKLRELREKLLSQRSVAQASA